MLVTKNFCPGESVYGEKRISTETAGSKGEDGEETTTKTEYRVWNPFRSKLAAGILGGLDDIFMKPGSKVLYLGAASGTSVSHVADIVGKDRADAQSMDAVRIHMELYGTSSIRRHLINHSLTV